VAHAEGTGHWCFVDFPEAVSYLEPEVAIENSSGDRDSDYSAGPTAVFGMFTFSV
jgi:hypothetical protein